MTGGVFQNQFAMRQSSCVALQVSGHKNRYRREEDPTDLPDVGFISSKQTRRQTRPLSEAIPDRAPYSSRRKAQRRSLQLSYSGSSTDEDERTNRAVEAKRGGTFAVGLAARNIEHKEAGDGGSDSDHEETCEYCAAEKVCHSAIVSVRLCTLFVKPKTIFVFLSYYMALFLFVRYVKESCFLYRTAY